MIRALACVVALAAPGVAFASGGGETGIGMALFWQGLNLLLLIGVIIYFGGAGIKKFFADRRGEIQKDIETSATLLSDAEARLAEWNAKVANLDGELAEIKQINRRLAEEERARILAQAEATAERIRNDARAAVDQELRQARARLRAEAADLAVELADSLLREQVDDGDQQRLFDEFIERVERSERPPRAS